MIDDATRTRFGVEGKWHLARRHVVRWIECDMHAHVNHAAYFTLFEDLRVEHWLGLGQVLEAGAPGPVVARLEARYAKPLVFRDEVLLTLRLGGFRNTSYTHDYAVWKDGLVFEAKALLVVVRDGAACPIPDAARAAMDAQLTG